MKLNTLTDIPGSKKNRKRVGRGMSSGTGKTCGRGVKGQKSRSGVAIKTEGGQMPLIKRLPKRGFNSDKSINYTPISTNKISALIDSKIISSNEEINKDKLVEIGYIKSSNVPVKLLGGDNDFKHKLIFNLDAYSNTAKEIIKNSDSKIL